MPASVTATPYGSAVNYSRSGLTGEYPAAQTDDYPIGPISRVFDLPGASGVDFSCGGHRRRSTLFYTSRIPSFS